MQIETIEDIVEDLADKFGIYGSHPLFGEDKCLCRVCWVTSFRARLDRAWEIEQRLNYREAADAAR